MNTVTQPHKPSGLVVPTISEALLQKLTPQARALVAFLNTHRSITQREALIDLSIQSLTKRMSELRKHFVIVSDIRVHKTSKQRYCRYFFKGVKPAKQVEAALKARPVSPELAP